MTRYTIERCNYYRILWRDGPLSPRAGWLVDGEMYLTAEAAHCAARSAGWCLDSDTPSW